MLRRLPRPPGDDEAPCREALSGAPGLAQHIAKLELPFRLCKLQRTFPLGNFRLLVAGNGEPSYENALKERSAGLPVEFLGFVSPAEFFQKTDILIVPSWEEPFGIVLLEAMATGIPVIATNRGGPVDIISSPLEGTLVPPRDPRALATAIQYLAADEERRTAITRNARQRVEKHFDIREVVARIDDLYRRVMGISHKKAQKSQDSF